MSKETVFDKIILQFSHIDPSCESGNGQKWKLFWVWFSVIQLLAGLVWVTSIGLHATCSSNLITSVIACLKIFNSKSQSYLRVGLNEYFAFCSGMMGNVKKKNFARCFKRLGSMMNKCFLKPYYDLESFNCQISFFFQLKNLAQVSDAVYRSCSQIKILYKNRTRIITIAVKAYMFLRHKFNELMSI